MPFNSGQVEDLVQWSRYLFRTVKVKSIADRELSKQNGMKNGIYPNEMYLLYFALLYVTIEAFRDYSFVDRRIALITGERFEENVNLLRNVRNSVFHPDKSALSPRQMKFLEKSTSTIPWSYALTDEFERFLYFYPESFTLPAKYAEGFRKEIRQINNWLPISSLAIIRKKKQQKIADQRRYVEKHYPDKITEFDDSLSDLNRLIASMPDSYYESLFE